MSTNTHLHEVTSDEQLDQLVEMTLPDVGTDLAELRRQAHQGRFESEKLRRTWFVIEGLRRG